MSNRVEAVARRLAAVGGVTGTSIGTNAQDAYRAALKGLKDAQKKLTTDIAGKATDDVLVSDRLAIQVAQAEVALAAAALARENEESGSGFTAAGSSSSASAPVASQPSAQPSGRASVTAAPAAAPSTDPVADAKTDAAEAAPRAAATRSSNVVDVYT